MAARVVLVAMLVAAGCAEEPPACEDVAARLLTCDLKPDALACERLTPAEQVGLFERLDEHGCEGLWSDDGQTVDARACEAFGWECPEPQGTRQSPLRPQYPLVFVGGIDSSEVFDWNPRIPERIEDVLGMPAYSVSLPSWSPRDVRTAALAEALDDLPGDRFNLVCYAVGGLDCRYLVSPGGCSLRILRRLTERPGALLRSPPLRHRIGAPTWPMPRSRQPQTVRAPCWPPSSAPVA